MKTKRANKLRGTSSEETSSTTSGTVENELAATAAGGTSVIVIDNSAMTTGADQVYFTRLSEQACAGNGSIGNGTGGCAIQASQSRIN